MLSKDFAVQRHGIPIAEVRSLLGIFGGTANVLKGQPRLGPTVIRSCPCGSRYSRPVAFGGECRHAAPASPTGRGDADDGRSLFWRCASVVTVGGVSIHINVVITIIILQGNHLHSILQNGRTALNATRILLLLQMAQRLVQPARGRLLDHVGQFRRLLLFLGQQFLKDVDPGLQFLGGLEEEVGRRGQVTLVMVRHPATRRSEALVRLVWISGGIVEEVVADDDDESVSSASEAALD